MILLTLWGEYFLGQSTLCDRPCETIFQRPVNPLREIFLRKNIGGFWSIVKTFLRNFVQFGAHLMSIFLFLSDLIRRKTIYEFVDILVLTSGAYFRGRGKLCYNLVDQSLNTIHPYGRLIMWKSRYLKFFFYHLIPRLTLFERLFHTKLRVISHWFMVAFSMA